MDGRNCASPPVGLCLAAFGDLGLPAALEIAAEVGADVVDLPTDSTFGLVDRLSADGPDPRCTARLAALLDSSGLTVHCVSNSRDTQLLLGPHNSATDPILAGTAEQKRAHGRTAAFGTVALASALGAPYARLQLGCPGFGSWLTWSGSQLSWQQNIDELVEQVGPVLDAATERGVAVVLEPHPKQVLYDLLSTRAVLDALRGWPGRVRLCLDPANLAAVGYDPMVVVRGWGADLAMVHVKDLQRWLGGGAPVGPGWCRYGPGPPIRFRSLGLGELPWTQLLTTVLDEGFTGPVYIEHEDATFPREQSVRQATRRVREMLPAGPAEGRTW
ncbi:MAG TPA: sugar phosphate isomerase/epimerase family protein [Jatrophihabitans sp.]|jgi:sugar phosphate isomerase/epimerase|nr:sugar phosphate isomerase/epimerase family protein [Jatrophihabitans sp.]